MAKMTGAIETFWYYLPPSTKLAVAKMLRSGFIYSGVRYGDKTFHETPIFSSIAFVKSYFLDGATYHKGWILEAVSKYTGCDEKELLLVTWEETGDAWSLEISGEIGAFEAAITTTIQLIDNAEREHNLSPGQLSLLSP